MDLDKDLDNQSKTSEDYDKQNAILEEMFPNAQFSIAIELEELEELLTEKKHIFITHSRNCHCYDQCGHPPTAYYEIKGEQLTYKYVLQELIRQNLCPECDHRFLEGFDQTTEIQFSIFFGS